MKKKILILGSGGLLGSHLVKFLSRYKKQYHINIFKRSNKYNLNNNKFCERFLTKKNLTILLIYPLLQILIFAKLIKDYQNQ